MSTTRELAIPSGVDAIQSLDSQTLYMLEQAGEIASVVLDNRIIAWTNESRSTRWIAERIGCDHSTVSRRQKRIGVESKAPRAGGQTGPTVASHNSDPEPEIVDAEVVPEPPSNGHHAVGPSAHWAPDALADDWEENVRTLAVDWFEAGVRVQEMLDRGAALRLSPVERDRESLLNDVSRMADLAARLQEVIADA